MNQSDPTARDLFEVLMREHGDALLVSIRANLRCAHRSSMRSLEDDIFQETVLVAWRRLADYDRTRPFGPWLRGIARLVSLDLVSRHARQHAVDPTHLASCVDDLTAHAVERDLATFERYRGGDETAMGFRERLAALDDCISRLPAIYAHCVQAAYRDAHTMRDVARAFDEQEETIKKRLQRARAMLAECLTQKGALA
ncbi:MAG: sigma-70 family RNA polymerase sigma factor [Limnohabitans sp.]|jgi:RNA polymerase sigma factor (sigma-70 family)|nr:sigma-70 family RNA polymerase sigma factor [Limnohabitans sp.]